MAQTVAHHLEGNDEAPLDPRGLFFTSPTNLFGRERRSRLQLLTPSDFVPGSPILEPSTWAMLLIGFAGLGYAGSRTRLKAITSAA